MGPANPFFGWLAAQPPFVEVALGIVFCLVIGPALLALVATVLTAFEEKLGRILSQSGVLAATEPGAAPSWRLLSRAILQELPRVRKAAPKRIA